MSYGISITNANNETVIDDSSPLLLVDSFGTVSPLESAVVGGKTWYRYGNFPSNSIPLFKINIGDSLARAGANKLWSTVNNAEIAVCKLAKDITPATSGYGLQVLNQNGGLVYEALEKLVRFKSINFRSTDTFGNFSPITTQGGDFFSITTSLEAAFFREDVQLGFIIYAAFTRTNSTTLQRASFSEAIPVNVGTLTGALQVLEAS